MFYTETQEFFTVIKTLGSYASAIIASITCGTLIIKPFREKFLNFVKKTSRTNEIDLTIAEMKKEEKQRNEEISKNIAEVKFLVEESNKELSKINQRLDKQGNASLCGLKNTLSLMYDKYTAQGWIPMWEKDNLNDVHISYNSLGGNHVGDKMYEVLMDLPTNPPKENLRGVI